MSLSKYYKRSDSFQPEELVKRDKKQPPGWQSEEQQKPGPFRAQPPPAQQQSSQARQPSAETQAQPQVQAPPQQTGAMEEIQPEPAPPTSPPQPVEPQIDLSNYIEKSTAEEKIEEAYQQGLQIGKEGVEHDFVAATRSLLSICQQLDTIRETIIGNSSEELHNFALSIAERILRISVREQDKTIIATIEEALQRAVKSDEFTIYIHPDDYQTVAEHSEDIIAGLSGLNKIVIKQDNSVERGGAKIESENCTIDATIASQFDVIKEEIMKDL